MSDIIHLLPDSVANQIAAGEVIQRPSSVVKELVENAVDAKASRIELWVTDAGRSNIVVSDDGTGMSETDARLAFERHATSKIKQASDLFSLTTMGFRGEALPSIAAVSQLSLRTRIEGEEVGTRIRIEGGKFISQEIDACHVGCIFSVRNLFFNVPARRKFLKSNQTELSNIIQEFERIALVNPHIRFYFHSNGKLQNMYECGSLRQRVAAVVGRKLGDSLLEVNVSTSLCDISGFVGRPDTSRRRGAPQFFFVNGRYMRHPYFQKAVQQAFDQLIPPTDQVPFFLYFQVDPSTIDVNIHPTKTEIKFENEQAIWQIVLAAVKEALGKFNVVPTIEFDSEAEPTAIPVYDAGRKKGNEAPHPQVDPTYNPFSKQSKRPHGSETNWQSLYQDSAAPQSQRNTATAVPVSNPDLFGDILTKDVERSRTHYQYRGQYILTETQKGLMFVDQHRAHIRILYNRYMEQVQHNKSVSQRLLFPQVLSFSAANAVLLEEIQDDLEQFGFDMSFFGGRDYSVMAIPSDLHGLDLQHVLNDMIENVRKGTGRTDDELRHRVSLSMARNAAIPVGQVLQQAEMEQLLHDLFETSNPNLTPDGRPIIVVMWHKNIEKMF